MKIKFKKYMNGFHWIYITDDKKHNLSIILHDGSYGHERGLFETMCSWLPSVQGNLTFSQIAQKIKRIERFDKK